MTLWNPDQELTRALEHYNQTCIWCGRCDPYDVDNPYRCPRVNQSAKDFLSTVEEYIQIAAFSKDRLEFLGICENEYADPEYCNSIYNAAKFLQESANARTKVNYANIKRVS